VVRFLIFKLNFFPPFFSFHHAMLDSLTCYIPWFKGLALCLSSLYTSLLVVQEIFFRNLSKLSLNSGPYSKTDRNQELQGVHNTEWQGRKWGMQNWIEPSGRVRTSGKNRDEGTDQFVLSVLVQKRLKFEFHKFSGKKLTIYFVQMCFRASTRDGIYNITWLVTKCCENHDS
jgi:hypothetical protein